ncbi:helix-turn-helix domain-containing protein [Allomuricauda taeanensis]|uniref:helix-turn-helix domain-containing protein n=1 Tax=Flagellimonas taeanensis TaxID=1005926 RepID=UPI002E7C3487|nr:helix-turn-helix domain-containing protein [Allomuricauda taeanensis]MEE1961184.1 helix-turn-helix domain-containing protein [Allomuricauda taeanensis]
MSNYQLIGIDLDSLVSIIRQVVAKELQLIKFKGPNNQEAQLNVVLSRQEAADFLGISTTTLWKLDKSGELPARRIKTKVVYYKNDLLNYLNGETR